MELNRKHSDFSGCFLFFKKFNRIVTKSTGQNIFYML